MRMPELFQRLWRLTETMVLLPASLIRKTVSRSCGNNMLITPSICSSCSPGHTSHQTLNILHVFSGILLMLAGQKFPLFAG